MTEDQNKADATKNVTEADAAELNTKASKPAPAHRKKITFNLQFTMILISVIGVFGVGVHFLHAFQVDRNADSLLEKSHLALEEDDLSEATRYLRGYLGFRPNDAKAVAELAQLLDRQAKNGQQLRNAYLTYQAALRLDSDRYDLRLRAAEIAVLLGRAKDALADIKVLRKASKDDVELSILAAKCHIIEKKYHLASREYLSTIKSDPTYVEAYSGLASLFNSVYDELPKQHELGEEFSETLVAVFPAKRSDEIAVDPSQKEFSLPEKIDVILNEMVRAGEPKHEALLIRSGYLLSNNRVDLAEADLKEASKLTESSVELLQGKINLAFTKASSAKELGDDEQFQAQLKIAGELSQAGLSLSDVSLPDPSFYDSLFRRAQLSGDIEQARKHLEDGLVAAEENIEQATLEDLQRFENQKLTFRMNLSDLLINQALAETDEKSKEKLLSEANGIVEALRLEALRSRTSVSWQIQYLDGRIHLAREEWKLAIPKLERVRNLLPQASADNIGSSFRRQIDLALGVCYQKLNNPDRRIVVFRRALEDEPFWIEARLELARSLAAANRTEDAIQTYQLLGNVPGAPLELARLLLVRELKRPEDQRNFEGVETLLQVENDLLKSKQLEASDDVEALRVEVLWQKKLFAQAQERLAEALKQFPDSSKLISIQVNLLLQDTNIDNDEKFKQAILILDKAEAESGPKPDLQSARLNVIRITLPENSQKLIESISQNIDQFDVSSKNQLLRTLAQTQSAMGHQEKAEETLVRLTSSKIDPLLSRLTLIEIATMEGDEGRVSSLLQEIREIEGPSGPYGNVVEVQQLLRKNIKNEQRQLEPATIKLLNRSREMLKQAQNQRTSWALISRLLGDVERLLGNQDVAVEYYRKAISQGDSTKQIVNYVVDALYRQQNFKGADQVIKQVSESNPELVSEDLARIAWRVAVGQSDLSQAVVYAKKATEGTRNYQDYIALSRLRIAKGERGESVEAPLLNALEHFPKVPDVWLAYVAYLHRVERSEEAVQQLKEAAEELSDQPESLVQLTLGRGYELLNDAEKAEAHYQSALKSDPENFEIHMQLVQFYIRTNAILKAKVHLNAIVESEAKVPENIRELANRLLIEMIAFTGTYKDGERALKMLDDSRKANEPLTLTDLRAKAGILARRSTKHDQQELVKVLTEIADRRAATKDEFFQLARLHDSLGNWNEARQSYISLLETYPNIKSVMVAFADALLKHDEIEEAKKWITEAKKSQADSLLSKLIESRLVYAEQGTAAALTSLEEMLEQDPVENNPAQVLRDMLANTEGQKLLDDFRRNVLSADTKRMTAMTTGLNQLQAGQIEQAIQTMIPIIEADVLRPHIKAFYYRSGSQLFNELNEYAAAEDLWRKAMEQTERKQDLMHLIPLIARQNRVKEALDLCDEQLWGKYPDTYSAQVSIAVLRAGEPTPQELQRVESSIANSIMKAPTSIMKRYLADLKDLNGQHEQAILLYRQVLNENQKDLIALNNMAYLNALIGEDLKLAMDSINQAIDIAGPLGPLLDTRGVVYLKRKEYSKAIADLEQANLETPSASTLFRLSQAYWDQGEKEEAKKVIQAAQKTGLSKKSIHPLEAEEYDNYLKQFDENL